MMSMKLSTLITAVVWLGCWTIPVITGSPVTTDEMERAFGPPLSEDELMSTPVFGKSAPDAPTSEGNDIIELPTKNAYVNQKWPNPKEIPYVIDSTFDSKGRNAIGYAMNQYHKNTCIRFVPRTNQKDYIHIRKIDSTGFSCYSLELGYNRGRGAHVIGLTPSCYASQAGTIMHELMHRVGFGHEHTRPDRDTFIEVIWDQITQQWRPQYEIAKGSSLILSYDYGSVMHYPLGRQMKAKKHYRGIRIGQRDGLSEMDLKKLNNMYCNNGYVE